MTIESLKPPKATKIAPSNEEYEPYFSLPDDFDSLLTQENTVAYLDRYHHCIYFNVNYKSYGNGLEPLIDELLPLIPKHKDVGKKHSRPALSVVLANLYKHDRIAHRFYTAMPRGKINYEKTRYNAPQLRTEALTNVVNHLHQNGLVEYHKGYNGEHARYSRIRATESLLERFKQLSDVVIGWHEEREVIVMKIKDKKNPKKKYLKKYGSDQKGKRDQNVVIGMRRRCQAYNRLLADTDISVPFSNEDCQLTNRLRADSGDYLIDPFEKHLYRVFGNSAVKGGRFYGAWWELVSSEVRAQIRINGDPVVELDFSAFHPTLLYLEHTNTLPEGDVYDLPVLREAMPEVDRAELRSVVKKAFLVLLNAPTRKSAKGSLRKLGRDEPEYALFKEMDLDVLFDAIEARHPDIWQYFGSDKAMELQNWDSKIADRVMEIMMCEKGIPCLPVHDSFIVAAQHADILRAAMEKAMKLNGWSHCPRID